MSDGVSVGGKVVFTFDGDEAGQKAAMKAFGEEQRFYAGTFVAVAPDGKDPCELWVEQGPRAVAELVDRAEPMFRWAILAALRSVDLETAEGRVAGLRLAAPVVAGIRDDALRRDYIRLLSGWLGAAEAHTLREVTAAARGRRDRSASDARPPVWRPPVDLVGRSEHDVLAAVLQFPGLAPPEFDQLGGDAFQAPELRAVHDAIRAAGGVAAAGTKDWASWVATVRDLAAGPVAGVVTALAVESLPVREGGEADYLRGVVGGLFQLGVTRRLGELRAKLGRLDAMGDAAGRDEVLAEISALMAQRERLRGD
jgi:DNA primase